MIYSLTLQRYKKSVRQPKKSAIILVKVSISLYNFIEVDWKLLKACIVSKLFVSLYCEFTKLMFN